MSSDGPGDTGAGAEQRSAARRARRRGQDALWTGPVPGVPSGEGGDLWSAAEDPAPRRRRAAARVDDLGPQQPGPRSRGASGRPTSAGTPAARRTSDAAGDRLARPGASPRAETPVGQDDPQDAPTPWVEPPFEADGVLPEPASPPPPDGVPVGELVDLTPPALVAREALNRAKAAARARGYRPGQEPRRRPLDPPRGSAGKDARDPQTVGDTLARLLRDRGWVQDVSVGGVIGRWREVVGDQIADHCAPETFTDGVLTVRTDSTAWATQVRLLVPRLLRRLADDVGEGVVTEVRVLGPSGPGFARGPRSVPGRGPRDTWG